MGSVNLTLRDFYDSTTELVGIKSGILLNRFQIGKILRKKYFDDFLKSDNLDRGLRLHSSEIEGMFITIRQRIGNLPLIFPTDKDYKLLREYVQKTGDIETIGKGPAIAYHYLFFNRDLSASELAKMLHEKNGYSEELSLALANIAIEKDDLDIILPESKVWGETTKLSDLFDCEIKSENNYLEQKFIDYLATNGHEIELIHWRNFERFCAEYFKREGYQVILGPGTNDGGVDIRAYKEESKAPELMIQCKRYKKENKVQIETVKSFYTDVQFEKAKKGLIATTGYIAKGGKKVVETRGYNITFAEKEKVKYWAKKMWKFK
jgi:restriction system protein